MPAIQLRPLDAGIAEAVRRTRLAPGYGHPVHEEVARGTGPCRVCLQPFTVHSDVRLMFTHNPFYTPYIAQPGPVFIHARECEPARGDAYPDGLRTLPVVAQPHFLDGTAGAPALIPAGQESRLLHDILESPTVGFIHLRHAEAGCFIARVDRAPGTPAHR